MAEPDDRIWGAMKRTLIGLTACAAILAGCGNDSDDRPADESARPAETTQRASAGVAEATTPARPRGPRVKLRDSQLGRVLFDGRDRALYLFTRDVRTRSRCYGGCAEAWPPFLARGRPRAARGVKQSLLGTIRRRDGSRQVTYKGQPLYFYVHDPRGQVLCNNVEEFGGTWYALTAEGEPPA
jgi:predicted lipoprotein with Yx(FWY)xxD motif